MTGPTSRRRPPARWINQLAPGGPGAAQEVILAGLRSVILAGGAPPGMPINVDDVAERFAVSRIPVREALKTLIGEALVEHEPRSGYRVARLTRGELAELYVVREALETAALTAAVSRADTEQQAEVLSSYESLSQAIAARDTRGHHRESRRFHLCLVRPCGMQRLLTIFESVWNITEPLQPMSHSSDAMNVLLHDDHRVMLEAFVSRDGPTLLVTSRLHYQRLQAVVAARPPA